jgi:hypothetical protein
MQDPCYLIVTTPASYDDASLDCIQKGGFLAPIKTPEEQAKIMALKVISIHHYNLASWSKLFLGEKKLLHFKTICYFQPIT